jgi:exonuclease VII large subunit
MTSNGAKGHRRFAGDLQSVGGAIQALRESFPGSLRAIGGECRAPRCVGGSWYFDLACLNGRNLDVLACRVTGGDFHRIDGYLRRQGSSLAKCMRDGMKVEVQGKIALTDDGAICLDVTKIAENFTRTGELHCKDRQTLDALRLEGVPSCRTGRADIHCGADGARPDFPLQFNRLLVIAPKESHGLADFKNRVRTVEKYGPLGIDYLEFRWASQAAPEMLKATLAESVSKGYDLILIIRGGGHWSKLRIFDHHDVALAIRRCPIPIATAIGHEPDTSMADRGCQFFLRDAHGGG